jgi:hypothetical protein
MKRYIEKIERQNNKIIFCLFSILFLLFPLSLSAAPTTVTYQVSASNDDAEEQNVTGSPPSGGTMYQDSTDIELVYDGGTRQVVGIRFTGIAIEQGTTSITDAYIQFTVDENDSGTTNLVIYGQAADDTLEFGTSNGNITSRAQTAASISWSSIPTWSGAGTAGADQRTPDISSIISEIVQRPGWSANNSIVIMFEPDGSCNSSTCQRTAESYDGTPAEAPQLVITLGVPGSAGTISLTSTDLEHVYDGGTRQVIGMRFQNVNVDQGETGITNAYIQYTVDETDSGITNVVIYGQDAANSITFSGAPPFPNQSPRQRFFIVDTPVSFVCNTGTNQITRHDDYTIGGAVGAGNLLVNQISACDFSYNPGSASRAGLVSLSITIQDSSLGGGSVTLLQQAHVDNQP